MTALGKRLLELTDEYRHRVDSEALNAGSPEPLPSRGLDDIAADYEATLLQAIASRAQS